MHSPIKLAVLALLSVSSVVNALPGNAPGGYTTSTKKTTTTPGGGHSTKTTCSSIPHSTWSMGHHTGSTCKPTTYTTETWVPYTTTITTNHAETTEVPVTSIETKTKTKIGYSSCSTQKTGSSISVQTIYHTHTKYYTSPVETTCPYTTTKVKTIPHVTESQVVTTVHGSSVSTGSSKSEVKVSTCTPCAVTSSSTVWTTSWETKCSTIGGYGK